ncbi:peroxiredoxin [Aquimarina sp. 2201CG1-2-11]|uniref:peroxiredoxin n=1 Tax=Aquimarina discodermiae TaxID=3231043 RepID=UPI0034627BCD
MGVEVGDFVPFFKAIDDNGQLFHSSSIIGVTPVVIYFYPKNFTPGCIKEACGFRDDYELFTSYGAEVIGISSDKVRSHARFKKRYKLPFVFLSDDKGELQKLFGVHSELFGLLPGRETYVIDRKGTVRLKFNDRKASSHIKMALKTLKEISEE